MHTKPNTSPSNETVVLVTRQYDSLRDIATQFLNNNTPPATKFASSYEGSHMLRDAYRDENGSTVNLQIKSEPLMDDYIVNGESQIIATQDMALDMRCVKPN
jgi:hypothetical protein